MPQGGGNQIDHAVAQTGQGVADHHAYGCRQKADADDPKGRDSDFLHGCTGGKGVQKRARDCQEYNDSEESDAKSKADGGPIGLLNTGQLFRPIIVAGNSQIRKSNKI